MTIGSIVRRGMVVVILAVLGLVAYGSTDRGTCPAIRYLAAGTQVLDCEGASVNLQDSKNSFVAKGSVAAFWSFVTDLSAEMRSEDWEECGNLGHMRGDRPGARWCRYSESSEMKMEAAWHDGEIRFSFVEW